MTHTRFGMAAAVLVIDTVLLLIIGAAMWTNAPSRADEAVGKGLVALAGALAIPAFVLILLAIESRFVAGPEQERSQSDLGAI